MPWIQPETRPLSQTEMENNAQLVANFFVDKGWTKWAISGMLGNMQSESTINPGRWQGDIIATPSTRTGFGMVQWTPPSKLADWANPRNWKDGTVQCERIQYEVENGLQWFPNPAVSLPNISFQEFTQLQDEVLAARYFIAFYEHPENPNQPDRGTQATTWLNLLDWNGGGGSGEICYDPPIKDTNISRDSFMSEQLYGYSSSRPNNFHNGLDFGSIDHPGSEMVAVCNGTISHVYDGTNNGLGWWYILTDVNFNFLYWESTMSRSDILVNEGDRVTQGQVLSRRTTDHLHLSVTRAIDYPLNDYLANVYVDNGMWIDPLTVLGHCFGGNPDPPDPTRTRRRNYIIQNIRRVFTYDYL